MINFNINILKTRKREVVVKNELNLSEVYFTYKDKNGLHYENLRINLDIHEIPKDNVGEYLRKHIEEILTRFNKTLKPYESKRTLVNVYLLSQQTTLEKL